MSNKPTTINKNNLRAISATGMSFEDGCVTTRVPANMTVDGGGHFQHEKKTRIRTPEHRAKAEAYWANLKANRQKPGHCVRCGKPHQAATRQCSKCLSYQAKYRGKLVDKDVKLTGSVVVAMVKQMRREMDKMQQRFKLWQKAAHYRRNLHYRTNTMRKKYLNSVSKEDAMDYLQQTNHAYEQNT